MRKLAKLNDIKTIWQRLIRPADSIQDSEQRRKASLLSALLLVLILLGAFNFISSLLADYETHSLGKSPYILVGIVSVALLIALYALSRTSRYKISASLLLAIIYVAIIATGWSLPDDGMAQVLPYLSLAVLLCSMLFSLRTTLIVSFVGLLGVLLLPAIIPVLNYLYVLYPLLFLTLMTALTAVAVRQRDLIEMDRRAAQNKVEEALRDSESRLRSLVTSIGDLVFSVDLEGRFLFYHAPVPPAGETPVVSMSEFVGYHVRDTMPEHFTQQLEQTIDLVKRSLCTQTLDYSLETDSKIRYFSALASPLISAQLKLLGVTVVSRDVTEAVQARQREQRLLEFEKLTRTITTSFFQSDNSRTTINEVLRQIGEFLDVTRILVFQPRDSNHIVDCTYEWHVSDVSPLIDNLQDLNTEAVIPSFMPTLLQDGIISAHNISELPPDMQKMLGDHGVQSTLILPFQTDESFDGAIALEENKGPRRWLPEEISAIRSIAAQLSRVIERERSQLVLVQARDAALRSARLKSEFMSNMSHEVRTPMTGLLGMLELLLETSLESEQREFAEIAFSSARNLLAILDDILDFSKIEAGRVLLEARPIDVRSIVNEVKTALFVQAARQQISFEASIGPDIPERVYGDPTRLRQVLTNLASNAIKFTSQGSVTIRVEQIGRVEERTRLRFQVRDTGIGISPEQKGRIFDSFIQADGTTTRRYGGTGLGLAICKQLVQLMGSEIDVESAVGQGSTFGFTLTLPIVEEAGSESLSTRVAKLRLVVVDDDSSARHTFAEQLRLWGANVLELTDQEQLLPSLLDRFNENAPINLVFWHVSMSATEQERLIGSIRNVLKEKTPYFIRLDDSESSRPSGGFDQHLNRPIDQMTLHDLLLGKHQPVRVLPSPRSEPYRVLVADDNTINQQIVSKALRMEKMVVDVAKNGQEALDLYTKNHYDLVLMDVHMPQLDGLAATRQIRAMSGDAGRVPVIALTASVLQEDKDRCIEAGMSGVLGKPFSIEQLRSEIHKWLMAESSELQIS